jgi:hypothetical protein
MYKYRLIERHNNPKKMKDTFYDIRQYSTHRHAVAGTESKSYTTSTDHQTHEDNEGNELGIDIASTEGI